MTGIKFDFVTVQYGNTDINRTNTQNATMSVQYWDGYQWVDVVGLVDGTKEGTVSFAQDGVVSWDAVDESGESKTKISTQSLLWYYKISFSHALSAAVFIDQIQGIPAQKLIHGYRFPVMWQNALWLLNEDCNKQNAAIRSMPMTVCVFNGQNSIEQVSPLEFGNADPITGGASLYTRFGGGVFSNLVVFKRSEVWIVDGTGPADYRIFKISDSYGCVAPATLVTCSTGFEVAPGVVKHILIWQAANSVVVFDGNAVMPISDDVKNYFDPTRPECINPAMIDKSQGFFDEENLEYHWMFAVGTSTVINKEVVYEV